jgi:hypothetical protein
MAWFANVNVLLWRFVDKIDDEGCAQIPKQEIWACKVLPGAAFWVSKHATSVLSLCASSLAEAARPQLALFAHSLLRSDGSAVREWAGKELPPEPKLPSGEPAFELSEQPRARGEESRAARQMQQVSETAHQVKARWRGEFLRSSHKGRPYNAKRAALYAALCLF